LGSGTRNAGKKSEAASGDISTFHSIYKRKDIQTIVRKFSHGIKGDNMIQYVLCAVTAILTFQPALQTMVTLPQSQDEITREEYKSAQETVDLFVKRFIETGDLAPVIDELFVADFIQRYKKHQKNIGQESNAPSEIFFAPGLWYKPDLLNQATDDDWRRFYIATYNFFYQVFIVGMNRMANDLLKGNTPDDKEIESIFPQKISEFFNAHPILKNFIRGKDRQIPIGALEEMRSVTVTLERGLRLLREELGSGQLKPSDESKKAIEMLNRWDLVNPLVEVSEKEFYGYPPGTRALLIQPPLMFGLILVDVNGKYKIVWAESAPGK
jgi:hypothetical protein